MSAATAMTLATVLLYLGATALVWQRLYRAPIPDPARPLTPIRLLGILAMISHASLLYATLIDGGALNATLTGAVSLVAWVTVAIVVLVSWRNPVIDLGIIVLPAAALAVVVAWAWPGRAATLGDASIAGLAHLVVGILAYGLFGLAVAQALLLNIQERRLRQHRTGLQRGVAPIETMESLLFLLVWVGFVLLSITLATGIFFSEQLFGRPLQFNHHIVLSLSAWVSFGILLAGHHWYGWRGQRAALATCIGFVILTLGYFGTRFVLEVVLQR